MPRILLIDDNPTFREVLALALTTAGHSVTEAADGRLGLSALKHTPFDLVITDIVMPDGEGLETILSLHRTRPELPVIAVSGEMENARLYLGMATRMGARRTFTKPFDVAALLRAIDDLTGKSPPQR